MLESISDPEAYLCFFFYAQPRVAQRVNFQDLLAGRRKFRKCLKLTTVGDHRLGNSTLNRKESTFLHVVEVDLVLSHTPSAPPKKKSLGTLNPKRRSRLRVGAALTAREGNDEGAADRPPLAKATMRAPRPKNLF